MTKYIALISLAVTAVSAAVLAVIAVVNFVRQSRANIKVEGRFAADSRRIVWRIVNTGACPVTIAEIGVRCGKFRASFRPLFASGGEEDPLPVALGRGELASYRKEFERFAFRPADVDVLKVDNPPVYFYAKDATGKEYIQKSEYKFAQYYAMLLGGNK